MAAVDKYRAEGPEETMVPQYSESIDPPMLSSSSSRADGRALGDCRPVFARLGAVTQARGSCYYEAGSTKVVSACYGPRDTLRTREYSARGKLQCEIRLAPFSCRDHQRVAARKMTPREQALSDILVEALRPAVALDRYPKSLIDVYVALIHTAQ